MTNIHRHIGKFTLEKILSTCAIPEHEMTTEDNNDTQAIYIEKFYLIEKEKNNDLLMTDFIANFYIPFYEPIYRAYRRGEHKKPEWGDHLKFNYHKERILSSLDEKV